MFKKIYLTGFLLSLRMATRKWWPGYLEKKRACKTHLYLFFTVETYRSPVETLCTNIDYYIPDDKGATKSFSEDAMARLREFLLGFFTCFVLWY